MKQLRINALAGTATTVLNVGLTVVSLPVYLHVLGRERYGLWLAVTTVLTFAQMGNLGLSQAITTLVARATGANDTKRIREYAATANVILGGTSALALLLVLLAAPLIQEALAVPPEQADSFGSLLPWAGVLSAQVLFVQVVQGIVTGVGRMDIASYADIGGRVAGVVLSISLVLAGAGLEGMVIGNLTAGLVNHGICAWGLRHHGMLSLLWAFSWRFAAARELFRVGLPLFGGSVANLLLTPFNRILLAQTLGLSALPVYEIAYGGAMMVRALFTALPRAVMPELSKLVGSDSPARVASARQLQRRSIGTLVVAAIPGYAVLFAAAPFALQLWLGSEGNDAVFPFRAMLVASLVSLLGVPSYYALMALGFAKSCFVAHVVQGIVNVAGGLCIVALAFTSEGAVYFVIAGAFAMATAWLMAAHLSAWREWLSRTTS